MATAIPGSLMTAEEFMVLPDSDPESKQELVRGVVVTLPLPQARRGFVSAKIGGYLGEFRGIPRPRVRGWQWHGCDH